jgi:hypothetical protein
MTQSFARPLSLGNVMSAGVTLYRSHLKSYFGTSLKAHLWALIPVYGWAKFEVFKAAIARHAFQELIGEPEHLPHTQDLLAPKLWSLWVIQILVGLILFGVQTVFNVGFQVFTFALGAVLPEINPSVSIAFIILFTLIPLSLFLLFITAYLWVVARFFIPELPYAIEENLDLVKALERSWKLSSGKTSWQIVVIIGVIAVIISPLYVLATIPPFFILIPSIALVSDPSAGAAGAISFIAILLFAFFLWIVLYVLVSACALPLWQSLKAVIYYDIRVRKEGLGLSLGNGMGDRPREG